MSQPMYQSGEPGQDLAIAFARTFGHDEGKRVLAHLRSLTRDRTFGPETPVRTLRYMEGQRSLVAYMERLVARGRT